MDGAWAVATQNRLLTSTEASRRLHETLLRVRRHVALSLRIFVFFFSALNRPEITHNVSCWKPAQACRLIRLSRQFISHYLWADVSVSLPPKVDFRSRMSLSLSLAFWPFELVNLTSSRRKIFSESFNAAEGRLNECKSLRQRARLELVARDFYECTSRRGAQRGERLIVMTQFCQRSKTRQVLAR